jgi:hypothetical protein
MKTIKRAHFIVRDLSGNTVTEYNLDYRFDSELRDLYEEARKVWSECQVILNTCSLMIESVRTYSEEVLLNFSKDSGQTFIFAE